MPEQKVTGTSGFVRAGGIEIPFSLARGNTIIEDSNILNNCFKFKLEITEKKILVKLPVKPF